MIIGSREEAFLADEIKKIHPGCIDLTGKTSLNDIVLLARDALAAVGNDTGPMHLIAPTGCPSCVLFSDASHPHRHAPKGSVVISLQEKNLEDLSVEKVNEQLSALLLENSVSPDRHRTGL